jgi:cell division protein ZipA
MKRAEAPASRTRQEPELEAPEEDDYDTDAYAGAYDDADDDILFTDPADEYRSNSKTQIVEDDDEDEVVAGWSSSNIEDDEDEAPIRVNPEDVPEHVNATAVEKTPAKKQEKPQAQPEHQELLVINAMAPEGKPFKGNDLLQILMACDVRYGKMNIFHRYENSDGTGEIQFSVANLVEPGNFDLDEIDEFTTPGVVFFMHLPGPKESIKAYEAMVETARCLVKNLEGELRDQTHSVATKQTLEHYKQRIRDFERRQLTLM